jgi:hypothetical protein
LRRQVHGGRDEDFAAIVAESAARASPPFFSDAGPALYSVWINSNEIHYGVSKTLNGSAARGQAECMSASEVGGKGRGFPLLGESKAARAKT